MSSLFKLFLFGFSLTFLSAQWEYVFSIQDNPNELPVEAKKYLSTVGIAEPTDAFRKELLENIFASYIERIMRIDLMRKGRLTDVLSFPDAAMAEALWVLDKVKNKQRICRFQRKGIYSNAWRIRDCNG